MNGIYNTPCNGDGHGDGYHHDCCGSTATWWLRPRLLRLNGGLVAPTTATSTTRLRRLNDDGDYHVDDGDDCGGHGDDC